MIRIMTFMGYLSLLSLNLFAEDKLSVYAQNDKVWLASFGSLITVEPETEISPVRPGEFRWILEDQSDVKEGQVIAYCDEAALKLSERRLRLSELSLVKKRRDKIDFQKDKKLSLERELAELLAQQIKLSVSDDEAEQLGADLMKKVHEEQLKLEEQAKRINIKLSENRLNGELELELETLELEYEQSKLNHTQLKKGSEVTAPHDGKLVHAIASGYVRQNEILGNVIQSGFAELELKIIDPNVKSIAPEFLSVSIHRPDGGKHPASYERTQDAQRTALAPTIHYYTLAPLEGEPVPKSLNGTHIVTVARLLNQKAYIIPKSKYLFSHTQEIQEKGWAGFVRSTFGEDAAILFIGPRSVAVVRENNSIQ